MENNKLIVLAQIVVTYSGIFDPFLHPVQEFRLKMIP